MLTKIILAGEGGQGVQTIAKVLTKAAQKSGLQVSYLPSFGVEQRGGVSVAYVQISDTSIAYPRFSKADLILATSNRSTQTIKKFLTPESILIYDSAEIYEKNISHLENLVKKFIAIPAKSMAQDKLTTKVTNIILLGVLTAQLKNISFQNVSDTVLAELAEKIKTKPELKDLNLSALNLGTEFAQNYEMENTLVGKAETEIEKTFENSKTRWTRFPEYCKGCALCIIRCPVKAITFSQDLNFLGTPMPIVDMEKCIGCGNCAAICPDGAIKVEKK